MSHSSSFSLDIADLKQTEKLGNFIGKFCNGGETIYLTGDLGMGKTTITQSIAKGMRIAKIVTSPTFLIAKEYLTKHGLLLLHADMYRATSIDDLTSVGITDLIGQKDTVTIVEWPEKIDRLKNYPHVHFYLEVSEGRRHLSVKLHGGNKSNTHLYKRVRDEYFIY